MDSSELHRIKQRFTPGAHKSLVNLTLPDHGSPDCTPILVYQACAHIALNEPEAGPQVVPEDMENVALEAVSTLARYSGASSADSKDTSREELRDLCIELEGEDADADEKEKGIVRAFAGTAFALAEEVQQALETPGAGTSTQNLGAVAVTVQIYLSINRPDLARKEFDQAKRWSEEDLLLQLIESLIGLVTGKDGYSDCNPFYTEQLGSAPLSSAHLLTAHEPFVGKPDACLLNHLLVLMDSASAEFTLVYSIFAQEHGHSMHSKQSSVSLQSPTSLLFPMAGDYDDALSDTGSDSNLSFFNASIASPA